MKIAPSDANLSQMWDRDTLKNRTSWQIQALDSLLSDLQALRSWATLHRDPISTMGDDSVYTPAISALGEIVAREINIGTGVAWIRGLGPLAESDIRLLYLKLGLTLGSSIDTYGRLCDVHDTGVSYKDRPVPVSKTRESTGMHTDSSGKNVLPQIIGLACVRQAPEGGESRLVSAATIHEHLRHTAPHLLRRLYQSYMRDVVTPGSIRDVHHISQNRFPIFEYDGRLKFRYMRYWIERGHDQAGEPLEKGDLDAFDALDAALSDPKNIIEFRMQPGDMLFIDNTLLAHDRSAFVDNPDHPRLMLRLWLNHTFRTF